MIVCLTPSVCLEQATRKRETQGRGPGNKTICRHRADPACERLGGLRTALQSLEDVLGAMSARLGGSSPKNWCKNERFFCNLTKMILSEALSPLKTISDDSI